MSQSNGAVPCLGELTLHANSRASPPVRALPACDYAEAGVWEEMGGGWHCLHGCYCQRGVSVEWHEFDCSVPREWSRSFHPESLEVCLNISGRARMVWGGESVLIRPMSLVVYDVGRGNLGAWRLPGEAHQFLTVEFSREFLKAQVGGHELGLRAVVRQTLRGEARGRRVDVIGRLTAAQVARVRALRHPPASGAARGLWYQGQALELMASCFFSAEHTALPAVARRTHVARERVDRALQVLSQHLAEPPSLAALGREVGCSPYHLSRTFSHEMGMTIPQYLRQIRMERAADLLRSGECNVTEAAFEVGYSSLSHFSQAFCETIGCCPGLYPLGLTRAQPAAIVDASSPRTTRRQ